MQTQGLAPSLRAFPGLNRIGLFGGGRWASTLLVALRQIAPLDVEIVWITKNHIDKANARLAQNDLPNVRISEGREFGQEARTEILSDANRIDAAVIATSPATHAALTKQMLERRIPTLCEKPIAQLKSELDSLLELIEQARCPCGLHLEFLYLESLDRFQELLSNIPLRTIDVFWFDPWTE